MTTHERETREELVGAKHCKMLIRHSRLTTAQLSRRFLFLTFSSALFATPTFLLRHIASLVLCPFLSFVFFNSSSADLSDLAEESFSFLVHFFCFFPYLRGTSSNFPPEKRFALATTQASLTEKKIKKKKH